MAEPVSTITTATAASWVAGAVTAVSVAWGTALLKLWARYCTREDEWREHDRSRTDQYLSSMREQAQEYAAAALAERDACRASRREAAAP